MSYLFNRWTLVSVGIVVGFAYYYSNLNKGITRPIRQHILYGDMRRSAVVIGATGATGETLVHQLLKSPEWGKVTIIHRRLLDLSSMDLTKNELSKLQQHTVNMSHLTDQDTMNLFKNHDVTFCTLGTTRDAAKTAENWRKVDIYMARDAAIASKQSGVKHFSLLTSTGANANIPNWLANDYKLFHGLVYMKGKGQIENEIINLDFYRTSIFRPGLLRRGKKTRMIEKIAGFLGSGTPVQNVAKAMIYDAESSEIDQQHEKPVFYEQNDIKFIAKL